MKKLILALVAATLFANIGLADNVHSISTIAASSTDTFDASTTVNTGATAVYFISGYAGANSSPLYLYSGASETASYVFYFATSSTSQQINFDPPLYLATPRLRVYDASSFGSLYVGYNAE